MNVALDTSANLQACLDRLREGDSHSREELLRCSCLRLTRLTRKMLQDFPRVHRWEETDDVFQQASMRICRALEHVVPASVPEFVRLAARHIRLELIDLARHYYGPQGLGAHHYSRGTENASVGSTPKEGESLEPARLAEWAEFHQQIENLPEELREVFDLVWYQGLSQVDVASLLAVHERTIRRRWREACFLVRNALHGSPPGAP